MVEIVFAALVVWREARGESSAAQLGVVSVIKNRVDQPGWWGKDVISVCTKPWQFTSMTGVGDPNLIKWPKASDPTWQQALTAAEMVLTGSAIDPTHGSTHYHDVSIDKPSAWGESIKFVKQIGRLKFYREEKDRAA